MRGIYESVDNKSISLAVYQKWMHNRSMAVMGYPVSLKSKWIVLKLEYFIPVYKESNVGDLQRKLLKTKI